MQFIYPGLLWALLLLLIPILIHLFYFRRFKKVYFSNVSFLKDIKKETSSRNRIKNWLILLSRLLALSALILAFALPYLSKDDALLTGNKSISIYIDNSYSMSAKSTQETILQQAKKKAIEITEAYDERNQFQILTSDFKAIQQRFVNQDETRSIIDEIVPGSRTRNLSSVAHRIQQAMRSQNTEHKIAYIISDFQQSISDEIQIDSNLQINFVPLQSVKEANISIDSVYFESGVAMLNQGNKMRVVLTNHGDELVENIRLSLLSNDQEKPVGTYDIAANASLTVDASVQPNKTGWHRAQLKITDYPIVFDDTYYFSYYVEEFVNILALHDLKSNNYLTAAFEAIPYCKLEHKAIRQIKYNEFAEKNLIILNDLKTLSTGLISALKQYVEKGGNLLVFPNQSSDISSYNQLLNLLQTSQLDAFKSTKKEVYTINKNSFVFDGVFQGKQSNNLKLPSTNGQYDFKHFQTRPFQHILKYRDGKSYLIKSNFDLGIVYLAAAPLNNKYSDLVQNAEIFVPMIYKMALSKAVGTPLAYTIGKDRIIQTKITKSNAEDQLLIEGAKSFIPGQYSQGNTTILDVSDQISEAGFYTLQYKDIARENYAFNYNNLESKLSYYSTNDLKTKYPKTVQVLDHKEIDNFAENIKEATTGKQLWRYFLIAALIFLLLEQLIIRFVKR